MQLASRILTASILCSSFVFGTASTAFADKSALTATQQPVAVQSRVEAWTERVRERSSYLALKVGILGGAVNYVDNAVRRVCAERNYRGECTRDRYLSVQYDGGWEAQAGVDVFVGARLHAPRGYSFQLGYSAIVTSTATGLMHRHMLSFRFASVLMHLHGGAGVLLWNLYGAGMVSGASAFLEAAFPVGRRGFYIGLPITMEWPMGPGFEGQASASVSLSVGFSVD